MASKPKTIQKRKASVRVSKKKRGISKLQAFVLVGALAVIGIVAVALTHASGTPNYQYSWNKYCISAYGKDSEKEIKDCKNTSAEAMVYRLYRGLLNRNPDSGGYKFWVQKLAGDRIKVTSTDLVVSRVAKMGDDATFVKTVFRQMLLREARAKDVSDWTARLKSKKWSRAQVVANLAASTEAITKNQAGWDTFVATAPTVSVVQNAAAQQKKRFDDMLKLYEQPNRVEMERAAALVAPADAQLSAAKVTAGKKQADITADDLKSIASRKQAAQSSYNKAVAYTNNTKSRVAAAGRLYDQARVLASFATDIGNHSLYGIKKIQARYTATKNYANAAAGKPALIKARVDAIAKQYAIAEKKYNAERARLAQLVADAAAAKQQVLACAKNNYSVSVPSDTAIPESIAQTAEGRHRDYRAGSAKNLYRYESQGYYDHVFTPKGNGCTDTRGVWYKAEKAHYAIKGTYGE